MSFDQIKVPAAACAILNYFVRENVTGRMFCVCVCGHHNRQRETKTVRQTEMTINIFAFRLPPVRISNLNTTRMSR